jgi:5-methylcytosine-specific restriction endonuclease McrA
MITVAEAISAIEASQSKRSVRTKPDNTEKFYRSWEWQRARYAYLKSKECKCQCCGVTPADGARIVVDHIKPIRHFWHLRLDPNNLQLLCDGCNRGKGSDDVTDWKGKERKGK